MVGKLKTEYSGGLADISALHEEAFGQIDDVGVDVVDGGRTCSFAEHVAEVVG